VRVASVVLVCLSFFPSVFAQSLSYSRTDYAGADSSAIVTADFNVDGKPDLAILDPAHSGVQVFYGTGGGAFGTPTSYAAGMSGSLLAVASFNGTPDLIVASGSSPTIQILMGPTFSTRKTVQVSSQPTALLVRYSDLVVAHGNLVTIYRWPQFGSNLQYLTALNVGAPVLGDVMYADVAADGGLDMVVQVSDGIVTYLGQPKSYRPPVKTPIAHSGQIAFGDIDGDRRLDAAIAYPCGTAGCVDVYRYQGAGSFALAGTVNMGQANGSLSIHDVNGDEIPDLVVANHDGNTVSIAAGHGDGTFGAAADFQTAPNARAALVRDLDLNSSHDIAVATGSGLSVLRNTGGSAAGCAPPPSSPTALRTCSPADGATVSSPFTVSISGNDPVDAETISVWLDGTKVAERRGSDQLQAQLSAAPGTHHLQLEFLGQSWSPGGAVGSAGAGLSFTVSGSPSCPFPASTGVSVCSPNDGATLDSPVHVSASGTNVQRMKVYVDYALAYDVPTNTVDFQLALLPGAHRVVVQGWAFNTQYNKVLNITVANSPKTCTATGTPPSVTICAPADGSAVNNPLHVQAAGVANTNITSMQVFIDGSPKATWLADWIDVYLSNLTHGTHRVTVQGKDANGALFKSSVNVTIQ
jgi:hypothetical protein